MMVVVQTGWMTDKRKEKEMDAKKITIFFGAFYT